MPISPFRDRFGRSFALTGSSTASTPPSVGVSSSFSLINTAAGGMKTAKIDRFRQGINVSSRRYVRRNSPTTVIDTGNTAVIGALPILTSRGIDSEQFSDVHSIEIRDFGQPKLFEDHEPFEDMATMKINSKIVSGITSAYGGPIAFLEDSGQQQYPVIMLNVSMKYPDQMDGVIEPLAIREIISNRSAETPFIAHRVRAHLMDGNIERNYGTDMISQTISLTGSIQTDPFIDAAEIAMSDGSTFSLFAQGYSSDLKRLSAPYIDNRESFCKILVGSGTIRELGLIDSNHKSAGSGFTYGNNPEGTDSIAFGGLKR
tara:strand:+ start:8497 stop:9444 length:948 start_codon:yes stop_codon:yes gene_type:complete